MKYVRLNDPSMKYQRFTPNGCRDIGIRKFEFVAKTPLHNIVKLLVRRCDFVALMLCTSRRKAKLSAVTLLKL